MTAGIPDASLSDGNRGSVAGFLLFFIIAAALAVHLVGIQRDLPYTPEADEPIFVKRSVCMASSGSLNPGYFGNPGSTVFYPLAAAYHVWNAVAYDGPILQADPGLETRFETNPSEFYLLGRLLTVSYAVMTVPLIYLVGRRLFGERVGLIACGLFVLYPIAVTHAQMVRTDSAAAFFGALSLWLCLRVYDRPTLGNHFLAGAAIGLAIATRYFMAVLIPVLAGVNLLLWWRLIPGRQVVSAAWLKAGAGLLAVAIAFAAVTPYLFLDFSAAWASVEHEARSTHLGHDGLSPWENLVWYVREAIPDGITWAQAGLAATGAGLVLWRRKPLEVLPLAVVAMFLVGISLSPLHWQRWLIPVLPLFALLVAYGLNEMIGWLSARLRLAPVAARALLVLAVFAVAAWPAYKLVLQDMRQATPSTRVLARDWMLQHLSPGSKIAQEAYAAPLEGQPLVMPKTFTLSEHSLEDYRRDGLRYLVASSIMYDRYLAEPDRYPEAVRFYERLFSEGRLVQEFSPSRTRGGPTLRIYEILPR